VDIKVLTAREVAELFHVHVNTVKRLPVSALPYFKVTDRGDRRYLQSDVQAYIQQRLVKGMAATEVLDWSDDT
jgi:hypothetical protein